MSMCGTRLVGITARGYRVGEGHHRATLTDREVELIRELAEGGMSQRVIAGKFEISRGTVADIVSFRRRASYPEASRRVPMLLAVPA
jgi:FixJ family two-component response regulator